MRCGEAVAGAAPAEMMRAVWGVLAGVPDPEIPVISVVDLGIVRTVTAEPPRVTITPTYTGCPATQAIERAIRTALDQAGFPEFAVATVISPPWSTDWISNVGREKLRAFGIAPPPRGDGRGRLVELKPSVCPHCGSDQTEESSRFGSTPCKALWRCRSCAEPFDQFKCH